jgi:predicted transcriptional regulator
MDEKAAIRKLRDKCVGFINHDDIRTYIKDSLKPIVGIIYGEVYMYVWVICMYNVFLIFITLANLFIVQRLLQKIDGISVVRVAEVAAAVLPFVSAGSEASHRDSS